MVQEIMSFFQLQFLARTQHTVKIDRIQCEINVIKFCQLRTKLIALN